MKGLDLKVAVYTIALNEAANAERWANSAVGADYRIVVDTGSTDGTVERLNEAGVTVYRIAVRPWRFDDARNAAMALIPPDVDVCCTMDMDRFLEPGWRAKLEAAWTPETTALYCQTIYRSSVEDPTPLRSWPAKNFHHRWGYRFKRPVHEALVFTGDREVTTNSSDIVMFEVQDLAKPTRSNYLPLMEVAHKEDPGDAQICFWLGRDLMWANQPERAVQLLEHYLALPTSTWGEERSEAMRYIARMQPEQKLSWLDKARMEAPHRREIWLDMAEEFHGKADWLNLLWACSNGIEKTRRTGSYLDEAHCWGARLYELGATAAWKLNSMDQAVEWGQKAVELDAGNQRLKNNVDFFIKHRLRLARSHTSGPSFKPARLFTAFGTVLYVDQLTGELRHGPVESVPANVFFEPEMRLAGGYRQGRLLNAGIGLPEPVLCFHDACLTASQAKRQNRPADADALELIPLERGLLALRSGGLFLSAIPNGHVELRAPVCSTWELFIASENWCTESSRETIQWRTDHADFDKSRIQSHIVHPTIRAAADTLSRAPRKAVICDIGWLSSYLADEHFYLVRLLNEDYDFDIIDCRSTNFAAESTIERLNSYSALLIAYQGGISIPLDAFSALKFLKIDDLVSYNPSYDTLLRSLVASSDVVISPYAYEFQNHFTHRAVNWVPYSSAMEGCKGFERIVFNETPISKVLVSGSIAADRPLRKYAAGLDSSKVAVLDHPGYAGEYNDDSPAIVRVRYYEELSKYLCCFCDGHSYRYIHLKNFEIASAGSLLLTDRLIEKEMNELGFVDHETCIFAAREDFLEKVDWILDDRNRPAVDEIRSAGMRLVKARHMTRHRALQIDNLVNYYVLGAGTVDHSR